MNNQNEEHGRTGEVTFGPLKRALREHRYPVSSGELVEQYGGFELETPSGNETLESVLRRCTESTFTEPHQIRDAIMDTVGADAIGDSNGTRAAEGDGSGTEGNEAAADRDAVGDWSQRSV